MAKKLYNDKQNGMHVAQDNMPELLATLKLLTNTEVLVGFPEETTKRDDPESQAQGITNAAIAYIHDHGAPDAKIPQRQFMTPGIESRLPEITELLAKTAKYVLAGAGKVKVEEGFNRVGLKAVNGIQSAIRAGIPPPLADSTVKARASKGRKGAQKELDRRANGLAPGLRYATPLMDTGEMLKSVTYVIRKRSARSK